MAKSKTEIIEEIVQTTEYSKKETKAVVDAVFEAIASSLENGESVSILGFGTFEVRDRAERKGRNPKTGETFICESRKVPAFKAGKALKEAVNK